MLGWVIAVLLAIVLALVAMKLYREVKPLGAGAAS